MVNITIDGIKYKVKDDSTILEAARANGVDIPSLCYFKDLNEIGACRICVVQVKGMNRLISSCNTKVKEGMEVMTQTEAVQTARKLNVQLILSQHSCHCPTCQRNGNCKLQDIVATLGVQTTPYKENIRQSYWDVSYPLVRDESKCIKCMRCIQVCEKIQGMKVWDLRNTGRRTRVGVRENKTINDVNCALCGQCVTHCPVGALSTRNDIDKVWKAIQDPETITVVQVAPAVRTAWAEQSGLAREKATPGHMAAALRRIGFDYVFDTDFSADLTIMEEGSELLERLSNKKFEGPMFTSCCPGWVRFMKSEFPDMVHKLSTSKSPQQMFGAVTKGYFADRLKVKPEKICCISIMPCLAKKWECAVEAVNSDAGIMDVDASLTTREFISLLKMANVDVTALPKEDFDSPMGIGTGAGIIFGTTGGVMEAAVRTAYYIVMGKNPSVDKFFKLTEKNVWKEAEFELKGKKIRIAVASGLGNARALVEAIRSGQEYYDFVEIMACPGGCSGGGGQPIKDGMELAGIRGEYLRKLDKNAKLRFSHENPEIQALYKEYMGKPLSKKAEHYLHTDQSKWNL